MINSVGGKGLDETQHCVGRKCTTAFQLEADVSALTCIFSNSHPSFVRTSGAGPLGCHCHPKHTNGVECCLGTRTRCDRRCFVNIRHLGWCLLNRCSVWGWSHSNTPDHNSKSINCSQVSQSHHIPLNHAFKSQLGKLGNDTGDTVS